MEITDALRQMIHQKAERLFRHEHRIIRIRIEVGPTVKKNAKKIFTAKGHIVIVGADLHSSEVSDDPHKAIDMLIDKMDRQLRQKSGKTRSKITHPHDVEIPSEIPKAKKVRT